MEEQLNSKSFEFLPVQDKKMVSILKKLEQSYEYGRKTKTKEILKTRTDKKTEFGGKKNNRLIIQNLMKPGCAVSRVFSQQAPISKGVPYLNEKEKRKVIGSNRAHTKMNNCTHFLILSCKWEVY
jgi:ribosomal protein L15E